MLWLVDDLMGLEKLQKSSQNKIKRKVNQMWSIPSLSSIAKREKRKLFSSSSFAITQSIPFHLFRTKYCAKKDELKLRKKFIEDPFKATKEFDFEKWGKRTWNGLCNAIVVNFGMCKCQKSQLYRSREIQKWSN